MKKILSTIVILLIFTSGMAQEGKIIDNFKLINAINQKEISLSDFSNKKAIAVIFTSNYCPYSKLYEDRIREMHEEFNGKGLQILLINSNDPKKSAVDSVDKMAERASNNQYPFPYLADKTQEVGEKFGASKTPEVFLLVKRDRGFQIVYHGAIDDNPQASQDVKNAYFEQAIQAVLSGKPVAISNHRPTGCVIKRN